MRLLLLGAALLVPRSPGLPASPSPGLPVSPSPGLRISPSSSSALQADDKKELEAIMARMKLLKNYSCVVAIDGVGEKTTIECSVADGTLYVRSPKAEVVRKGTKTLTRPKDGEWKEGPPAKDDFKQPYEAAAILVSKAPAFKKERTDKIRGVTVVVYAYSFEANAAKDALKESGAGLWQAWVESIADWSRAKNGVLVYVSCNDKLVLRVEQRVTVPAKVGKARTMTLDLDFGDFGTTKLNLPEEVKAKLK
ncbi:MAG: hypothetical protein HYY17_05010 [Planctomycetes bacterium]|nr:hypothetical protein [Planctomycetota bacterium]